MPRVHAGSTRAPRSARLRALQEMPWPERLTFHRGCSTFRICNLGILRQMTSQPRMAPFSYRQANGGTSESVKHKRIRKRDVSDNHSKRIKMTDASSSPAKDSGFDVHNIPDDLQNQVQHLQSMHSSLLKRIHDMESRCNLQTQEINRLNAVVQRQRDHFRFAVDDLRSTAHQLFINANRNIRNTAAFVEYQAQQAQAQQVQQAQQANDEPRWIRPHLILTMQQANTTSHPTLCLPPRHSGPNRLHLNVPAMIH